MAPFTAKYTPKQRDALAHAYSDRKIRPASLVVAMAANGELDYEGEVLEPFEVGEDYIRDLSRKLKARRTGKVTSELAQLPPRDAIEALRRRLINVADAMVTDIERGKASQVDPERMRQIVRVVREAAAIPGPTDPRPKPPGAKSEGKRTPGEGETRGGLAGELLRDHRASTEGTAPEAPTTRDDARENEATTQNDGATRHDDAAENDADEHEPGQLVRELAAAHLGT